MKPLVIAIARFLWMSDFISDEMYIHKFLSLGSDAVRKSQKYNWSYRFIK